MKYLASCLEVFSLNYDNDALTPESSYRKGDGSTKQPLIQLDEIKKNVIGEDVGKVLTDDIISRFRAEYLTTDSPSFLTNKEKTQFSTDDLDSILEAMIALLRAKDDSENYIIDLSKFTELTEPLKEALTANADTSTPASGNANDDENANDDDDSGDGTKGASSDLETVKKLFKKAQAYRK